MTHLTLTGIAAGQTLCGAVKETDPFGKLLDQYVHAMYAPIEKLKNDQCPNFSALCPECLKAWDDATNEETN